MITPQEQEWVVQNMEAGHLILWVVAPAIFILLMGLALLPLVYDLLGDFASNKIKDPDYITKLNL